MQKIAVIGDIHYQLVRLQTVLEALAQIEELDGVLLVGDIGLDRDRKLPNKLAMRLAQIESIRNVLDIIGTYLGVPVIYVPGNHDPKDPGLIGNADQTIRCVAGLEVFGVGGAPGSFGFPYEWQDATLGIREASECDILLFHAPPFGTSLDVCEGQERIGSKALRSLASAHKGILFCGHVHESSGFDVLGECLCVNVGALGPPSAYTGYCLAKRDLTEDGFKWMVTLYNLEDGTTRFVSKRWVEGTSDI